MGLRNWFSPRSKHLVGIDIGSTAVKIASLKGNGSGSFHLEAIGRQDLPDDAIVDGAILSKLPVAEAINQIYSTSKIKNQQVATSISGHSVIVKKVTLPAMGDDELGESIQWEAEQYIPFDISDVNVDYQVLQRSPEGQKLDVVLVAAKKEKINDHTSAISMSGKFPAVVDIDAFALQNIYEFNYQPDPQKVAALLNVGATVMNINVVQGSSFQFTRDIAIGGSRYTDFLQKELGISKAQAEQYKKGIDVPEEWSAEVQSILNSVTENLAMEVEKTFDYFKTTTHLQNIDEIFLSGGACRTLGLSEYLKEKFQVPVSFLDPFKRIEADQKKFPPSFFNEHASDFAIAVGLALRTAQGR